MKNALSDRILQKVEKPIRYIGNEWNSVIKCVSKVDIRFAFCFPDVYEVGMSHLGMRILYHDLRDDRGRFLDTRTRVSRNRPLSCA